MVQTETFKALVLDQDDAGLQVAMKQLTRSDLPDGDVLVAVEYSDLNYKDGLAVTGTGKIVRNFPMVPGIDFSGTVVESRSPDYQPGDKVILTGWFVGERHWGGYAQMACVKSDWLVHLPDGMTTQEAMAIGTAGFTSMLAVMALEDHGLKPDSREVIVTGAAGGLGSVAVAVLAHIGYNVAASTGRSETHDYLRALGAKTIVGREEISSAKRALESERWSGAVDSVGGDTLAGLLSMMAYHTSIAVCGNAGGVKFASTVMPFLLRGVNLLGIDSVSCPQPRRREAWNRLARDMPRELLARMTQVVSLEAVPDLSQQIIKGQIQGRVVIDLNA